LRSPSIELNTVSEIRGALNGFCALDEKRIAILVSRRSWEQVRETVAHELAHLKREQTQEGHDSHDVKWLELKIEYHTFVQTEAVNG